MSIPELSSAPLDFTTPPNIFSEAGSAEVDDALLATTLRSPDIEPVNTKDDATVEVAVEDVQPIPSNEASFLRKHRLKLSLGALAAGMVTNPLGETVHKVLDSAPWAAAGVAGSEVMWGVGAAMALAATGKQIGNPFKLRARWQDIKEGVSDSTLFKAGMVVNTLGALGTAGTVIAGSVAALPPETWPGSFSIAALDIAGTVAIRKGIYSGIQEAKNESIPVSKEKVREGVFIRHAQSSDLERLAEIDLARFKKAYGADMPTKAEVMAMFSERLANSPDWMFVAEVDGIIEGFVSGFRTDKPCDEFVSWEESTADGTLHEKVVPDGKYVYITNMTVNPEATELGAEDMLIANLFANGIRDGVEYGYFASRMPLFKRWVDNQIKRGAIESPPSEESLQAAAEEYVSLTKTVKGKQVRLDPELRMYEGSGFKLGLVAPNAFSDEASMNYGVVCRADVPPKSDILKSIKPLRLALAGALRYVAKNPKLLNKVL